MPNIKDSSIDMILCDLPYGTTSAKWDIVIPFDKLWKEYKRIIKDNGCIALFGTEAFSSHLRMSNLKWYRYDWIWSKSTYTNFYFVKKQPAKKHEIISIFYKKQPIYNPQMEEGKPYKMGSGKRETDLYKRSLPKTPIDNKGTRYPSTIQFFKNGNHNKVHPTQKPLELLEYMINTYTNENALVLDNCFGSGNTCLACINTNRNFIGIEKEKKYFNIAKERIRNAEKK